MQNGQRDRVRARAINNKYLFISTNLAFFRHANNIDAEGRKMLRFVPGKFIIPSEMRLYGRGNGVKRGLGVLIDRLRPGNRIDSRPWS
jgi:hypothetical protein